MELQRELPKDFVIPDRLINSSVEKRAHNTDQPDAPGSEAKKILKRVKTLGRPKNGWTASKKRKLIRLYLNTDLEVEEIKRILETNSFHPCKRDIQKNLNILLQHRPNQIRPRGMTAKERIQLLMECKNLRPSGHANPEPLAQSIALQIQTQEPALSFDPTSSLDSTPLTPFVRDKWPDLFPNVEVGKEFPPEDLNETNLDMDTSRFGSDKDVHACYDEIHNEFATRENICPVPRIKLAAPFPGRFERCLHLELPQARDGQPDIRGEKTMEGHSSDDNESISSRGRKDDGSLLSLRSLKKRLKLNHSMSSLDDIKSLIERLTVSDSDASSIRARQSTSCSPTSSPTSLPCQVTLPGVFPKYCWDRIWDNGNLLPCDDIRLACNHIPMFDSLGTCHSWRLPFGGDHQFPFRQEDLIHRGCTDIFGNSVLHVAAALGSPLSFIISLIKEGADVIRVNSANQTFLHLLEIQDVLQVDVYLHLLEILQEQGFRFETQDHTGQRALSLAMLSRVPQEVSARILNFAKSHNLEWTSYCDNQEHTAQSSTCDFCDPCPHIHKDFNISHTSLEKPHNLKTGGQNGQEQNIKNSLQYLVPSPMESPGEYEYHAKLLKTIRNAGNEPNFEDGDGRNGLHCLSEVCLDLPIPSAQAAAGSGPTERRQQYLEQLLQAGVNPNSHDKNGNTPLMAFVFHLREDEDDSSTYKILNTFFQSGANIHRHNAQGETALHLAVKLGRRAAMKFLLSHGANVHARTSTGQGVLALGYEYSHRATHDELLYAQISLCMSLAITAGAVSSPSLLDEWAIPRLKDIWMNCASS